MANLQYNAIEGDRWDTVSYRAYGSASFFDIIIKANPLVPITPRLIGGTILIIPIIADNSVQIDAEKLPPWKRNS